MLTALAYLADAAVVIGYLFVCRGEKYVRPYYWVNLAANAILLPYDFIQGAPAAGALAISFTILSIYGLVKPRETA